MSSLKRNGPSVRSTRKGEGTIISPKKHFNIATWNTRTMWQNHKHKMNLLQKTIHQLNLSIVGISETHWDKDLEEVFDYNDLTIFHSCRKDGIHRQGVAIAIKKEILPCVKSYDIVSPRIISLSLEIRKRLFKVVQIYAPDSNYTDEEVGAFYDSLQSQLDRKPRKSHTILLGDFNAIVGKDQHKNFSDNVGHFGLGVSNERGWKLLEFCAINNLVITNTLFKHSENRRFTWVSPNGTHKNQIDYIIADIRIKSIFKNSRSYHSADIGSDHSLVGAKLNLSPPKFKKSRSLPKRFNVEKLKDPDVVRAFQQRIGGYFEPLLQLVETNDIDTVYTAFKQVTNKATDELIGRVKHRKVDGLPQEVEKACEERRKARLAMLKDGNDVNVARYRELNKDVKKSINKHKKENLEKKVVQMENDFQRNNSFNLFKTVRELEDKRTATPNLMQDKNGVKHTDPAQVLKVWEDHFKAHLNKEFPHKDDAINEIPNPAESESFPAISIEDVREAVKKMKKKKAPGVDEITAEVLIAGGEPMIQMLHAIFTKVERDTISPKDWSKTLVNPVHKKGCKSDPENYRAISLISIPSKVFLRILLKRMTEKTESFLRPSQFGFRKNRGTVDAIFIVRQILEKARERNVKVHLHFIDFKAAFDTIWRKALWKMMRAIGIDPRIVDIVENIYSNAECAVVVNKQITNWFKVKVGVRQGCLLSPVLFNIFLEFVMDELKSLDDHLELKENMSTELRYADDTTLVATIFEKLEISTAELETACSKWGMKINASKCKTISDSAVPIQINNENVENVSDFVFLGSNVPGTTNDIKRRLGLASSSFGRLRDQIWRNKDISLKLKLRLYNALIVPIAIYASETWTLKKSDTQLLLVFEMRCFRSLLGLTLMDRVRNVEIRNRLGITSTIVDIIRKRRLSWFGHVIRRDLDNPVKIAFKDDFTNPRPRRRPPKRWKDQLNVDTGSALAQLEEAAMDRLAWKALVMRSKGPVQA